MGARFRPGADCRSVSRACGRLRVFPAIFPAILRRAPCMRALPGPAIPLAPAIKPSPLSPLLPSHFGALFLPPGGRRALSDCCRRTHSANGNGSKAFMHHRYHRTISFSFSLPSTAVPARGRLKKEGRRETSFPISMGWRKAPPSIYHHALAHSRTAGRSPRPMPMLRPKRLQPAIP